MIARRQALVVDDNPGVRKLLRRILEPVGYRVAEAADGAEALARLRMERADLLTLDLDMVTMDGATLVAELDRAGLREDLTLLVLSAHHDAPAIAETLGADGCLRKPFGVSALRDLIARLEG